MSISSRDMVMIVLSWVFLIGTIIAGTYVLNGCAPVKEQTKIDFLIITDTAMVINKTTPTEEN